MVLSVTSCTAHALCRSLYWLHCVCSMQMFLSIGFAAVGVAGAVYSLSVAALGLANGPTCFWSNENNPIPKWGTPFANRYSKSLWMFYIFIVYSLNNILNLSLWCLTTLLIAILSSNGSYLTDKEMWKWCQVPKNVVEFNVGLFSTLLVAACIELVLCLIQMVNGLFGCLCGTCSGKEVRPEQTEGFSTVCLFCFKHASWQEVGSTKQLLWCTWLHIIRISSSATCNVNHVS